MSEGESHHHGKHEIIIVKRHKGDHDGAHGGAWKIAYADFMTAMMAFFLIMWLVNAANEETKAAVASYFNPIKLTDPSPATKGLQKPAKESQGEETQDKSKSEGDAKSPGASAEDGQDKNTTVGEEVKYSEADYFENPYAVIAEISKETDDKANVSTKGEGGATDAGPGTGADGGEAFRDPFDPDFWTQQIEVSRSNGTDSKDAPAEITGLPGDGVIENAENSDKTFNGTADEGDKKSGDQEAGDLKAGEGLTEFDGTTDAADTVDADKQGKSDKDKMGKTDRDKDKAGLGDKDKNGKSDKDKNGQTDKDKLGKTDKEKLGKTDKDKNGKDVSEAAKLAAAEKQAKALQAELRKMMDGKAGLLAEGLIVTPAEGGLLISISDHLKMPMFQVGSSIPTKETVAAMDRVARLLKNRPGQIAIRGHTDARPYKNKAYDNWRLSTDRAQSAYFMLVHGGLDEKRVSQVSGFADHRLKFPDKPMDEGNRRIEILVQAVGG